MNISNCKSYELEEKVEMPELKSTGYLLRHKKTKARVVLMENDDDNKVFSIGFRTPPKDSTGVAHIVEHTVLCGSRDFPVKDPFIELAKGSLNTFLNAMTYPDKTVYPVASCNDKDFQNLMHVYLDAVFYPNIYNEEKIFRQEGWHYELEEKDAPLIYNGVVFNEMKGVFSSPAQLLERNIQRSLFPDTPYGVESGGDPEAIPDLTYEDYLSFHSKYYHPSNSYIYLYGDMDMEEKLNWIDEHYLSDFEAISVDSEVTRQKAFECRRDDNDFYSVTEGEETEGKAYFSYNAVCGDGMDRNLYRAFQVLCHVLVQSVGAPLKQALLDAGIGNDISCFYEESLLQPFFSIIAKNVRMEQKQEFLDVIEKELTRLVKEGINKRSLLAAINGLEFQYREADFGNYPKGLMYGLQIFDSWLYDDDKPFIHIRANDTFTYLKEQVETDYFEKLIKKYLLNNTHKSFASVQPQVGLTGCMEEKEKSRLAAYKAGLSEQEKEDLVRQTEELKRYQEEPTPAENLKCIPLLNREDIGKKAQPYYNEEKELAGVKTLHHAIYTNGINYFRFIFDVKDLKEYTPYLSLLTELVTAVDTEQYTKLELANEILLHAGGIHTDLNILTSRKTDDYKLFWEIGGKALFNEMGEVLLLLKEILEHSKMGDTKRLREVIGETRSLKQMSLLAAGHTTAVARAMSYQRESSYINEHIRGIAYYDFLCDLEDNFEDRKEDLITILEALMKKVFVKERLMIDVTADEDGYQVMTEQIDTLLSGLPQKSEITVPEPAWRLQEIRKNEGIKTAGKVQYVARIGNFAKKGIPYHGVNKVVRTILGYEYLWNEVRVKGGAYGVMCALSDDGNGYMVSYRDPNLLETNEVYEGIPKFLSEFAADERDMMKYIIGTVSDIDIPMTPRAKGRRSANAYMTDITFEDMQRERDEILAADAEKVREAAKTVEAVLSDGAICAIGSEAKVEQAGRLFDTIRVLN